MKKITVFFLIFTYTFLASQTKALTEDGREVILLENKTWRFANETDEKTLDVIETNETPFVKSNQSSFLLRSKKVEAGIYIDPKKWKTIKMSSLPTAEYTFQSLVNPKVMTLGCLMSENAPVQTLKNLRDLMLASIQSRADYFKLNKSEYRTVNGIKVLFIDYSLNTTGMDFHYIGNYYLTEDGYCNVVAFTYEKEFEKSQSEMLNFINGLVKTEKSKTAEIIEYTSPPPPMETKKK